MITRGVVLGFLFGLCAATTATTAYAEETSVLHHDQHQGADFGSRMPPLDRSPMPTAVTIDLLTMGPGEHPFYKFGHNALRVRDPRAGTDKVYNFGTFAFDSPTLIYDFFKGLLRYWLSTESMRQTLAIYREENRSLSAQRLALSPDTARSLADSLEKNALPQNRTYQYDYFFDNCSTRLRDAIDRATQGQVHASLKARATRTLRDHALRATSDYFIEYLVLQIGLGPLVDRKTDRWTEAFLPEMLAEGMRQVSIRNEDGSVVPLVKAERVLLVHRDNRPAAPPNYTASFLAAGTALGLFFMGLGRLSQKYRVASVVLGFVLTLGGLIVGLLGIGLAALWAFTNHAVTYGNQNLLLVTPLAIALPWYGLRVLFRGAAAISRISRVAWLLVITALGALCIKVLPIEWQDNANLIAFFLPCWVGLLLTAKHAGLRALVRPFRRTTRLPERSSGAAP